MKILKAIEKKFNGVVSICFPIALVFLNVVIIQNRFMKIDDKPFWFRLSLAIVLTVGTFYGAKFFSSVKPPKFEGAPDNVDGTQKVTTVGKFVIIVTIAAAIVNGLCTLTS